MGWPKSGRGREQPGLGFGSGWAQGTSPRTVATGLPFTVSLSLLRRTRFLFYVPPFIFAVFIVHDSSVGRDNEKEVGARGLLPACGALKRKETSRCLSCGATAILQRESNAVQNPLSKNPCRCCSLVTHVKAFCFCICASQKSVSQTR